VSEEGLLALIVVAVPVLLLYGYAVVDVARRRIGPAKTLGWVLAIVLIPGIGVLAYYAMRPLAPLRDEEDGASGVADAVGTLRTRWESGDLDDAGYLRAKQQLFRV